MNMAHDHHILYRWYVFVILYFYVLFKAHYGYTQCGFICSAVWRFCNIFSSSFRLKLALNREHFLLLGVGIAAFWTGIWKAEGPLAPL